MGSQEISCYTPDQVFYTAMHALTYIRPKQIQIFSWVYYKIITLIPNLDFRN
jgi:hypothetical protein